jgi:hypothetical protein
MQLDSMKKELYKVKELLADKEKEDRRLQEAHLKQLRDMEKEVFKKEDVSTHLEKTIRDLEVRRRFEVDFPTQDMETVNNIISLVSFFLLLLRRMHCNNQRTSSKRLRMNSRY